MAWLEPARGPTAAAHPTTAADDVPANRGWLSMAASSQGLPASNATPSVRIHERVARLQFSRVFESRPM